MEALTDLLSRRYSAKTFTGAGIPSAQLKSLLEAARWAPSAWNDQPCAFIVAPREDRASFDALLGCLGGNAAWAKDAAVLMACCVVKAYVRNGEPNAWKLHDLGLAVMAMAVQGVSLGLQQREMAGIDGRKAEALFGVPNTHEVATGLAIGVPGDNAAQRAGRARRGLESMVHAGRWGARPAFLDA